MKCFAAGNKVDSPAAASFKRLEAARVARLKKVGQGVVRTLKQADREARMLWIQEMQDLARQSEEALRQADAPAAAADDNE